MHTLYEIFESTIILSNANEIKSGCTRDVYASSYRVFGSKDEALSFFGTLKSNVKKKMEHFEVTEYWLVPELFDEDDNFISENGHAIVSNGNYDIAAD